MCKMMSESDSDFVCLYLDDFCEEIKVMVDVYCQITVNHVHAMLRCTHCLYVGIRSLTLSLPLVVLLLLKSTLCLVHFEYTTL